MSLQAHIDSLAEKRNHLKDAIAHESTRPMPDFAAIRELKKQNLALKEEMQRYLIAMKRPSYNTSS